MTAGLSDRNRRLLTALFVVILAVPLFGMDDSVPLSSYPMYARPRADTLTFVTAVGIDADGADLSLTTGEIADTRDPLVAETWLRNEVSSGRSGQACREIASRVGERADVVEIRREQHRVVDRVLGAASLVDRVLITECNP